MTHQPPDLQEKFKHLFRGHTNRVGRFLHQPSPDVEKKAWTLKEPPTDRHWQEHLTASGPGIGIVPINEDSQCYWGAIDVDDHEVDHAALAKRILELELPLICCRSRSGGAHLFVFFHDSVPAKQVIEKLKAWQQALNLTNTDGRPIEIFPKQASITEKDTGNWINLPYYGGDGSTRYAVTPSGPPLTLDEFIFYAESKRLLSVELEAVVPKGDSPFVDGPPCLFALHAKGFPAGQRNNGLFNIAIFFKLVDPDGWEDRVRAYNQEYFTPPKDEREVEAMLKSISSRDYVYQCEQNPLKDACQKRQCKKMKYGIDAFRKAKALANMPTISDLRKITTDPPIWIVTVNGEDIQLKTPELQQMPLFSKLVLEKCNVLLPPLRGGEWHDKVVELLADLTVLDAPEDAGVFGTFKAYVNEFLSYRKKAETREDLKRGLPWEDNGKVYFRSMDLYAFLERRKFKDYHMAQVYSSLRMLGAGDTQFNIKSECVRVWWLPTPDNEQKEPFTPPAPTASTAF